MTLDDFYENKVCTNLEVDDEKYGYFIMNYKFDIQQHLEKNAQILLDVNKNLKHLLD